MLLGKEIVSDSIIFPSRNRNSYIVYVETRIP